MRRLAPKTATTMPSPRQNRDGSKSDPYGKPIPARVRWLVLDRIDESYRRGQCCLPTSVLIQFLRAVFPEDYPTTSNRPN